MSGDESGTRPVAMDTHYAISTFLYREAGLLDETLLRRWINECVSPDIHYRMAIRPERHRRDVAVDGSDDLYIYDDGFATLEMRVLQYETGLQKMHDPLARMVRTTSNIEAFETETPGYYLVRSYGILNRFRREYEHEQIVYIRSDRLKRDSDGFRIVTRDVHLPQRVFDGKNLLIFL